MRTTRMIIVAMLVIALLAAAITPVSAVTDPSNLNKNNGKDFKSLEKILKILEKIHKKVTKFFEKQGFVAGGVPEVFKTLTLNPDGTWHIAIYQTVPTDFTGFIYDYPVNLVPIPGSFTPIQPNVVNEGYIEYDNLPPGTYVLQFNATQPVSGYVADEVYSSGINIPVAYWSSYNVTGYNEF
ncbi:hypothetical protein [Methanocella paludicola]|nr:hypothetical protein [Methanocella paludicola]